MTALYMYDAANSPNLATCKRHGAIAMAHYMTRSYASTSPQPEATRNLGMAVLFNAEGYAAELKGATRTKGRSFAQEALATIEKGVPRDGTVKIFYSVDTDLTDLSVCDEAFRGINDAHRGTGIQVGLYGEGGLMERLHGLGLVQGGQWLSMSEGFGGFTHAMRSGLVAAVQMHDAAGNWIGTDIPGTDRNTILDPHSLGAWWPDGSPYALGDDMPLSDADVRKVADAVWQREIKDPVSGKNYYAASFLTSANRRAGDAVAELTSLSKSVSTVVQAVAVDAGAVATAVRDKLVALIKGGTQ